MKNLKLVIAIAVAIIVGLWAWGKVQKVAP